MFSRLNFLTYKPHCFLAACVVYGLFSSPTPDAVGPAEIFIGVCLLLSVGLFSFFKIISGWPLFNKSEQYDSFFKVSLATFIYLLLIPLALGLVNNHHLADILRDVIPLFYLFLPLLLYSPFVKDPQRVLHVLLVGTLFIGVAFSMRFLLIMDMPLHKIGEEHGHDGLLYLAGEPCVLFAALYLPMRAFSSRPIEIRWKGDYQDKRKDWLLRVLCLMGGAIAIASLAATVQRGPIVFILAILSCFFLARCRHNMHLLFLLLLTMAFSLFFLLDPITGVLELIWVKTLTVGDNARIDEIRAVIDTIRLNFYDVIWGKGWGALVLSPAAGHVWVRYAHVLWSYILLKAGLMGVIFLTIYLFGLVPKGWKMMWRDPILFFSMAPSLFMGVFLTPSFKILGFGLLLCILVFHAQWNRIKTNPPIPYL